MILNGSIVTVGSTVELQYSVNYNYDDSAGIAMLWQENGVNLTSGVTIDASDLRHTIYTLTKTLTSADIGATFSCMTYFSSNLSPANAVLNYAQNIPPFKYTCDINGKKHNYNNYIKGLN